MEKAEIEKMVNSMSDTYLEEIIDKHYEHTEEDIEAVDRVIAYRKMSVPLKLTVKDHHYATVLRKTGTLPPEIMFDEKYVHIENILNTISVDGKVLGAFLVVLTRAEKVKKEMAKPNAMACMNLKEIYDRYLKNKDYLGIMIHGGNKPYPVSIERIERLLGIVKEEDK